MTPRSVDYPEYFWKCALKLKRVRCLLLNKHDVSTHVKNILSGNLLKRIKEKSVSFGVHRLVVTSSHYTQRVSLTGVLNCIFNSFFKGKSV